MKNNTKKALSASTIASLLITSSAASVSVKAAAVTPPENPRLWGADRYETAVKVSQAGWGNGSDYAILASGEGYADALSAAPLAKVNNAPILLTQSNTLSQTTLDELKRLKVKHVFIVGGQGVVSQSIEDTIKAQVTSDTQRLWGQNRYETSVKVAEKLGKTTKVVLASGEGYADALSAAPVAAIEGIPVLLTESKTLSKATADYIKANSNITKTYVIGGTASVSDSTLSVVPGGERFGGADRYETNAKVINSFASDFDFKKAYIALGNGPLGNEFADALTGTALAAKDKAPLIITGKVLSQSTSDLIKSKLTANTTLTVLGGTANLSDDLVSQALALRGSAPVVGGGSGGGSGSTTTSSTVYINQAGTYSNAINGDAYITASDVILTGNVGGDLHIDANNTTASSITVGGTVYVNPGATGEATLDNVTAKNIVVLSGAANTVKFKNVKADKLTVASSSNVRIESIGNTAIANTEIKSQAILQADAGSFGTITIPQSAATNTVKLIGSFDRPIIVQGNVDLQTEANTSIPALVVSENVNASGIKLSGLGVIAHIQIKSETVKIIITGKITITGAIVAVISTSVDTNGNETHPPVTQKPAKDMDDVTSYNDITSSISKVYAAKINSYMANHPNLNNYFTITTGSAINVQLNKESLNSLSSAFDRVQALDISTIEAKLTKVQDQIDLRSSYTKIDGLTVKEFLAKLNSPYIKTDGSLNVKEIAARIYDNTLTYDKFKQHLKDRIEATFNTSKFAPKLSINYGGVPLDITSIYKDGNVVYSTSLSREANIINLLNFGDLTAGTYKVYSGTDYFTVKVLPAPTN